MKTKLKGNLYAKLIAIALIIATVFGIFSAIKKVFAEVAEEVNEENNYTVTEEAGKIESWLNSEDYLVVDWDISRIAPNTKIDKFKSEFNKNIILENGADTDEKSTNISTDSTVIVEDENKSYKVSVVGDLDKDGQSNQVELTSIIRATVNPEMWSLEGIFEKSADMELDGKINKQDVNASINYIVYGDLEIPEFAPVKAPLIEVISGTYNENIEAYEDDIEIRITTTQENAQKTVYKVVGTVDTEYKEIVSGDTVLIKSNGMYGIKAYTYGELGNRSDINYLIVSKKNATADYTVEHYLEELDGTYTKDEQATETLSGRIGEQATATPKYYLGYSENTEHQDRVASGIVKEDGSLVLKLYYSRNSYEYTVKYFYDNEIDEEATEVKEAVFGSTVTDYTEKQKEGYILDVTKGDNGVIGLPLTISAVASENVVEVYYVYNDYRVVIHHYKEGTGVDGAEGENSAPESIVADEELRSEIITTFTATDLLNENNINTIGETQISDRQYLDANKYTLSRVERNEEKTTIDEDGVVSGNFEKDVQEIIFWYSVNTYEITGEVVGGNGILTYVGNEDATEIKEIVEYDENATQTIIAKPNTGFKVESLKLYAGENVDGTYGDENDGGEDLLTVRGVVKDKYLNVKIPKTLFRGIRENKHVVVTYKTAPIVAQIVAVPEGSEEYPSLVDGKPILDHVYYTLEAAIEDAAEANKNPGEVEIQILADIDGEINTIEAGNNVIIDLNGYNISLGDEEKVNIEVKQDGSLTVIDKSELQDGAIINTEGIAVYIREDGELTLGNINMPVYITSPTIQGKTHGIYRKEGSIFNFYDGQVIGETNTAIAGYASEINTPELYEVVVAIESPKQTAFLSIPSGIEAMIGRTKYNTLEQAFQAVEEAQGYNINTPVEIDVVAEVTIEDAIKLSSNKNVILDLNGNNINATQANYIFENSGNMEIKDSSALVEEGYEYATLVNNGEYYFEVVDDHLEANNKGVASSTANSYIEIDLENESSEQEFTLALNTNISSQSDDYGYATVTTTTDAPVATATNGRLAYVSGLGVPTDCITTLTGGQKYYLHLGYRKNAGTDYYLDTYVINSITLDGKSLLKELPQGTGKITSTTYGTIKNEQGGKLVLTSGSINIERTSGGYGAVDNYGTFTMQGGKIKAISNNVCAIRNLATVDGEQVNLQGGIVIGKNSNAANADMTIGGTSRLYWSYNTIENSGNLNIQKGTITSTNSNYRAIYQMYNATATIENAKILAYTYGIYNSSTGNLNLMNNTDIRTYNTGLYTGTASEVIVDNANFVSYGGYVIQMEYNNTKLTIESANIDCYNGIYVKGGTLNIKDLNMNSKNTGITTTINNSSTISNIIIENANITANQCIHNYAASNTNGEISIYGGTYTATGDYAIYNYVGTVNIGRKNDEQNTEVSTENPVIQGAVQGAYNVTGILNFYDGQIIAPVGKTIVGTITEIEEVDSNGNELDINISKITKEEVQYDKLTLQPVAEPVAKILKTSTDLNLTNLTENTDYTSDDQYYYFYNLQDAVSICSTTAQDTITEIELMKDIVTVDSIEVVEGQNIEISLNGNKMETYSSNALITNNGTLKINENIENSEYKVEAEATDIVKGTVATNDGKTVLDFANDFSFNFTVETEGTYELVVNGKFMTRNSEVFLNGNSIYNFANSGAGSSWDEITGISLGNLESGEYTLRFYNSASGYGPIFDYFIVRRYLGNISVANTAIINNGTLETEVDIKNSGIFAGVRDNSSRIPQKSTIINNGNYILNGGTIEAKNVGIAIENTNTFVMNNGVVNALKGTVDSSGSYGILNTGTASTTINNGTIYCNGGTFYVNDSLAIRNMDNSTIIVNGGTINAGSYVGIYNESTSVYEEGISLPSVYITGGTIKSKIDCVSDSEIWLEEGENSEIIVNAIIEAYGKLKIDGGTYTGTITNEYGTESNIANANITSTVQLGYNSSSPDSTDLIKDTVITGTIAKKNGGTLEIADSVITSTSTPLTNSGSGTVTINNSTIKNTETYYINMSAITNSGTGKIIIPSKGQTEISTIQGVAIENTSTGSITIGTKGDGIVSEEYPKIIGNTHGIYNTNTVGVINFYDGIITGATLQSIYGTVTDIEEGYDIVKLENTENSKESSVLRKITVAKILKSSINEANLTNIEHIVETSEDGTEYYGFYTIEDAATACTDNQNTTILITRDITYTANVETQTIPENKDIVLDLAGYKFAIGNSDTFVNNAKLEIIDSSADKTALMTVTGNKTITNNNELIMNGVTATFKYAGTAEEYSCFIDNTGNLNLEGTTITVSSTYTSIIKNSGELNVTGGTILEQIYGQAGEIRAVENCGETTVNSATIAKCYLYNYDSESSNGTIEIVDIDMLGGIINHGTSKYKANVSEPAFRISGGTIETVWAYDGTKNMKYYNFDNYSGEVIIEKTAVVRGYYWIDSSENASAMTSISNYDNGIITIDAATVSECFNNVSGTITINSGTITTVSIINAEGSYFNILGGNINDVYTSVNYSNPSVTITNNGTMTIGNKEDSINETQPILELYTHSSNAFTNNGTLNFYDGEIKISAGQIPVIGVINDIPENSEIIYTMTDEYYSYKLSKNTVVATIGDSNEYYTLESAFEAAKTIDNAVIKMQESIAVIEGTTYSIGSAQNTTLDLNGKKIRGNCTSTLFTNEGTYELTDSTDTADTINGNISTYALGLVENTGALKISGGAYDLRHEMEGKIIVNNTGTGTVEMTGGKITAKYGKGTTYNGPGYGIKSTSTGNITISGGQIECSGADYGGRANGIYIENTDENSKPILTINGPVNIASTTNSYGITLNNARLIMSDGTIATKNNELNNSTAVVSGGTLGNSITIDENSTFTLQDNGTVVAVTNKGIATVTGGTITGAFDNNNSATISGATVIGAGHISNSKGTMTIENTNINTTNTGLSIAAGTVDVNKDVTITSTGGYAISVSGGTLNILDNLIANNSSSYSCVYISSGAINVTGNAEFTSTNAEGIKIYKGTVNLGNKAYPVTKDYPKVTGGTYGVYRSGGTFNFYDGVLKGNTKALYGEVTDMPELYSVVFADETETTAYLGIIATTDNAVKIGEMNYPTLSAAINTIKTSESKEGTIVVLKDLVLSEPVEIFEGLNVVLDLQGHSIRYSSTENATIINNGVLTIIDTITTEEAVSFGYIENVTGVAIQNNGTLTLGSDDENVLTNAPKIIGGTYAIENATDAILNFYDGMLEGITAAINGATITNITSQEGYSVQDGTLEVDGDEADEKITYLTKYLGK